MLIANDCHIWLYDGYLLYSKETLFCCFLSVFTNLAFAKSIGERPSLRAWIADDSRLAKINWLPGSN
jgi:hypothetical protein